MYHELLRELTQRYNIDVYAYCLMPTHLHLVAVPPEESSFSNLMRDMQTAYASRLNLLSGLHGHIWENRFHSSVLDEPHLWNAVCYVERNPLRANMVNRAE